MENKEPVIYEYAVIRCVPRIHREEFFNIGLIMMCKRWKWLNSRIQIDEKKLTVMDPSINIDVIKNQARVFELKGIPFPNMPVEESYRWLTAAKSAILQTSSSHPGIIGFSGNESDADELLEQEFNRLFEEMTS